MPFFDTFSFTMFALVTLYMKDYHMILGIQPDLLKFITWILNVGTILKENI
jgi:hypothetical protein